MLTVIALIGPSCSGKSTWVEKNREKISMEYQAPVIVHSLDEVRSRINKGVYVYDREQTMAVKNIFYKELGRAFMLKHAVIIIDNTNINPKTIRSYLLTLNAMIQKGEAQFFVKIFKRPYYELYMRNLLRRVKTGKFVPIDELNRLHVVFTKMDYSEFDKYLYNE